MKNRIVSVLAVMAVLGGVILTRCQAQILQSAGTYTQSFDTLAASGTANAWTNNVTLAGWYSSRNGTNTASYRGGDGGNNAGDLWSYGVSGVSNLNDRALGSVASGTATPIAFGVRFINGTAATITNLLVTYTGEQWRNGGNTSSQTLGFSYQVSSSPLTNAAGAGWINFPALDFVTPTTGTNVSALDGNAATNRLVFTSVQLTGVSVGPAQELFLRWSDINDGGNDHGFGIDDLNVSFSNGVSNPPTTPEILVHPQSQTVTAGDTVTFDVSATGNPTPGYQWQFASTNLSGATGPSLMLNNVSTNQSGNYRVIVSNSQGSATSEVATLTVNWPGAGLSLLTYNVKGNGAADWTTNAQVQAIARQLQYLQPDVITFNEIPKDYRAEMTNFITAFLPGYQIVVSDGDDFYICSAIASRFPITRATSWLDAADLKPFGYTNTSSGVADNFTRDLFEAQIAVPGFARPLHVFTTHLKASDGTNYVDNAAKRAAEAAAITNFFATNLFVLYPYDLYVLTGDLNANDTNELCIQRLLSPPTGLTMTLPRNPVTGSINTYSTTTANPSSRLDYIFPGPLLYSNIKTSQVFRTDRLTPLPPNLNSNDCKVASDHLPVLMVFNNPYDKPFKLLSITRTNPTLTLKWESVFGQPYRVDASTNLATWTTLANNLVATTNNLALTTNLADPQRFFRVYRMP